MTLYKYTYLIKRKYGNSDLIAVVYAPSTVNSDLDDLIKEQKADSK